MNTRMTDQSLSGVASVSSASRMTPEGARYCELTPVFSPASLVYPAPIFRKNQDICEAALKKKGASYCIFRGAESRRYGDLTKELSAALLVQKEDDGLRGVDGRTAAD
jgi:hypothetical protein